MIFAGLRTDKIYKKDTKTSLKPRVLIKAVYKAAYKIKQILYKQEMFYLTHGEENETSKMK